MKSRIFYAVCFVAVFCVEVLIGVYVRDAFVRPYLGDVLVVVLIHFFVRVFIPRGVPLLPLYVFLFACLVEVSQAFHLADTLAIENPVARVVLGSMFDWKDIACYASGCLLCFAGERLAAKKPGLL
ncbi:MAG: DUF2809 domain-containing protein [Mediterranea sp.]|nr:DUF2809 domain-containing protein [Mediterranea sp.]